MSAQLVLNRISQSEAEQRRERDYIDSVNTELTILLEAQEDVYNDGLQKGIQVNRFQSLQAFLLSKFEICR